MATTSQAAIVACRRSSIVPRAGANVVDIRQEQPAWNDEKNPTIGRNVENRRKAGNPLVRVDKPPEKQSWQPRSLTRTVVAAAA